MPKLERSKHDSQGGGGEELFWSVILTFMRVKPGKKEG